MAKEFSEGLMWVQLHGALATGCGYLNRKGKLVIKKRKYGKKGEYYSCSDFSEGLAAVTIDTGEVNEWGSVMKVGFINKKGKLVIPPRYNSEMKFHDGVCAVSRAYLKDYELIDKKGKILFKAGDKRIGIFSEGVGSIGIRVKTNKPPFYQKEQHYFVNKKGERAVTDQIFEKVGLFKKGLAFACPEEKKCGFLNKQGDWVIEPQFEDAHDFSDGMAAVKVNGKWGYIARP